MPVLTEANKNMAGFPTEGKPREILASQIFLGMLGESLNYCNEILNKWNFDTKLGTMEMLRPRARISFIALEKNQKTSSDSILIHF